MAYYHIAGTMEGVNDATAAGVLSDCIGEGCMGAITAEMDGYGMGAITAEMDGYGMGAITAEMDGLYGEEPKLSPATSTLIGVVAAVGLIVWGVTGFKGI